MGFNKSFVVLILIVLFQFAFIGEVLASPGLTIYASEITLGKFHRYGNKVHPYPLNHAARNFILPDGVEVDRVLEVKNGDGSFTIFFNNLEDLLAGVASISKREKKQINLLNIEIHGGPGEIQVPVSYEVYTSQACENHRNKANLSDADYFRGYYGKLYADNYTSIRKMSNNLNDLVYEKECGHSRIDDWKIALDHNPGFVFSLSEDVQINFISCVLGAGKRGAAFSQQLAELLFPGGNLAEIRTTIDLGLLDWSMTEGMGFENYISELKVKIRNGLRDDGASDHDVNRGGYIRLTHYDLVQDRWTNEVRGPQMYLKFNSQNTINTPVVNENSVLIPIETEAK